MPPSSSRGLPPSPPGIDAAVIGSASRDGDEAEGASKAGHLVIRRPWPGTCRRTTMKKNTSPTSRVLAAIRLATRLKSIRTGTFGFLAAWTIPSTCLDTGSPRQKSKPLAACPEVGEAAAVPMPHALKGEGIYAYVVTRDEVPWSAQLRVKLRDAVRRDIGALASPEFIQFVDAMPKTTSGEDHPPCCCARSPGTAMKTSATPLRWQNRMSSAK